MKIVGQSSLEKIINDFYTKLKSKFATKEEVNTGLSGKAPTVHNHDTAYYKKGEVDTKLNGKSDTTHTHDDRYFTESEMTSKLATKSDTSHTHDTAYYKKGEVDTKLDTKSDTTHTHDTRYVAIQNPTVTDFNTLTSWGVYRISSSTSIVNAPYSGGIYGELEVFDFNNGTETMQRFTGSRNELYIRFKVNSNGTPTWLSWAKIATTSSGLPWENITNKPTSFTPSTHTHDDMYYTESEMNTKLAAKSDTTHAHAWDVITGKPSTFAPIIGTSSTTAFRGDQGLTAYNHSQVAHAPTTAQKNSDITKAEIEAKLTGLLNSHNHHVSAVFDGRGSSRAPKDYTIGHEVSFRNKTETDTPPGAGSYTTIHTIKGWHDKSGGVAAQMSYSSDGGTLPELGIRIGAMDATEWGPWQKVYSTATSVINARPEGDHGFGNNNKSCGFIGSFPGWATDTLYINTYSKDGVPTNSFSNVEVNGGLVKLNTDLRVKHTAYMPRIREIDTLQFNTNFGQNYILAGNGDGATYDTHNLIIRSWWGIGFRNNDDECKAFINTRTGDIQARGIITADDCMRIGQKIIKIQWEDPGDIGEGGIWIRS